MANNKVKIRLQGHEKFALREGWLTKGLTLVSENNYIFQEKNTPDIFGIGNNMVKSLRYWMRALGLIKESSANGTTLSLVGNILLEKDPYIEDIFSLWILHSYIAQNISEATTWYMYFNRCENEEFDKEQIEKILSKEIVKHTNGSSFSEKSLRNDIDVLLGMYSKVKIKGDPEDKTVSPFSELNLVKNSNGYYSKCHSDRKHLSEWIVLYELSMKMNGLDSISIDSLIQGECGLTSIYNMTSVLINDYLDKLDNIGYIRVDRTAGLDMIYRKTEFTQESVLKEYYDKHR